MCIATLIAYDEQHAEVCAAVLPIVSQIVQDTDHVSWYGTESPHWHYADLVPPMGSGYPPDISAMAQGYDVCGYSCTVNRTGSASQRLFLIYVATHGWLRGFVAKLAYLDIACSGHGERDWAQADLSEKTD